MDPIGPRDYVFPDHQPIFRTFGGGDETPLPAGTSGPTQRLWVYNSPARFLSPHSIVSRSSIAVNHQ